ncbi:hypothetical protein O59_002569 [Cellvibrio sp. BR]|nr:hypothetical protein O59_002569 [Cellvibrio sp. BR]
MPRGVARLLFVCIGARLFADEKRVAVVNFLKRYRCKFVEFFTAFYGVGFF